MPAAIVSLCELAVAALQAAALAGSFAKPVTAQEDYALTLSREATPDWTIFVQPGPCQSKPATLDGDVREEISVRIVLHTTCRGDDLDGIKALLALVELAVDTTRACAPATNYVFVGNQFESSRDDPNQQYDQVALRDDGVFYSCTLLNFDRMRSP